jgi:hypothetical protein
VSSRLRSRGASLLAAALAVGAVVCGTAGAPETAAATRRSGPYVLGDSVTAWSAANVKKALRKSAPGAVVDAVPCRGLVFSCVAPDLGRRPLTGLQTIRANRGRLGSVVVIELGYNDCPLRASIDRVMTELRRQKVRRVIWVNLSERRTIYRRTNRALAAASKRWRELRVLDWRGYSAEHDNWFLDGVHLTRAGRAAFARFLVQGITRFS